MRACNRISAKLATFLSDFSFQIYVSGKSDSEDTAEMLKVIRERLIPGKVLLLTDHDQPGNKMLRKNVVLSKMRSQDGQATAFVCRQHTCSLPITSPCELATLLDDGGFSAL